MRRSSSWRSSTSRSGACVPWRRNWRSAPPIASFSSDIVMTSLFTTATIRSTRAMPWECAAIGSSTKTASKALSM
jgi:hypothetical protein